MSLERDVHWPNFSENEMSQAEMIWDRTIQSPISSETEIPRDRNNPGPKYPDVKIIPDVPKCPISDITQDRNLPGPK